MGLFSKTDEEIKQEEINRKWSLLNNAIWDSGLDDESKRYLAAYTQKVKKGYPNDFGTLDNLVFVISKIIDSDFYDKEELENHFEKITRLYHTMVDPTREDSERMSELFLQNMVGTDGLLYRDLFNEGMYSYFNDKNDYYEIMDIIERDSNLSDHIFMIIDYIHRVSKYCLNQDILKRDIISYLEGFSSLLEEDYGEYTRKRLEEAKKRIGIYSIDSKELATVDSKLGRIESYFDQISIYLNQLDNEKKAVSTLVENGKKDIRKETKLSVEQLKSLIELERKAIIEKLDQYLLDLEESLKNKSDETFRQIMETYQKQVQEFRTLFQGYSLATSKDLLAIQKATEESVSKLREYVSSEPQLQELLHKAQEQNAVREKIIELVGKEEELLEASKFIKQAREFKPAEVKKPDEVSIPGYEQRIMVPYRHMVLPPEISNKLNPYLDENIPFSKRKEELLKRMEAREKEGEIFHKKVAQIAIDVMEGDWPYLWGPSGTGKSYMVKQVASLLGMDLTKAGKITEPYSVLGYNDPQGRYQITPSFIAALYGHLLFLDEMDNGNPDTQVVLNDIYSELLNKLEDPNEICEVTFGTDVQVDVHPNFRMVAAGNTSGEGENETFSSRGKMDESIQERMTPIYVDYDNRVEESILHEYPEWYEFFVSFRNACMKYAKNEGLVSVQGVTTTRDASAIKKYISHNSKSVDQVIAERFIQIKDSEYRKALGRTIADKYGLDYDGCEDFSFKGTLKKADGKVLAKKFVVACKKGVD